MKESRPRLCYDADARPSGESRDVVEGWGLFAFEGQSVGNLIDSTASAELIDGLQRGKYMITAPLTNGCEGGKPAGGEED